MVARKPLPYAEDNGPVIDDGITVYDRAHLFVYARLLDAAANGASDAEMIRDILELEPGTQEAADSLRRHLARASWMRECGYRQMLSEPDQDDLSSLR